MGLLDILNQALNQAGGAKPEDHFDQVAQQASPDQVSAGLAEAFRSDKTPAFGDMVGQLFGNSNGQQQAGALNSILASLGPAALATIAGSVLTKVMQPGQQPQGGAVQITPEQASQLSPQDVRDLATAAEKQQPGVIDQLSRFYAEHPTLVKTLGGGAALIMLSKVKRDLESR